MKEDPTTQKAAPYDFGTDPVSVNLHRPNVQTPNKESHRMRKPTVEQWLLWGHEIYEERRNLSQEEIEQEKLADDDDDEPVEVYEKHYNEYEASRHLYESIAIEVTTYRIDEDEEWHPHKTYPLTPDLIEKVIGTDAAISGLYHCYCEVEDASGRTPDEVEEDSGENTSEVDEVATEKPNDEVRVHQTIGVSDKAPSVVHVLRRPTDDERIKFQFETLRSYAVAGKPDTMRICLNLRVTSDIYDALLLCVENATVNGQAFDEQSRATFKAAINPVFKLKVLEAALDTRVWHFAFD